MYLPKHSRRSLEIAESLVCVGAFLAILMAPTIFVSPLVPFPHFTFYSDILPAGLQVLALPGMPNDSHSHRGTDRLFAGCPGTEHLARHSLAMI